MDHGVFGNIPSSYRIEVDTEHLLKLVAERSILWDRRRSDYKNKNLTDTGWHEVCCKLFVHFESYDDGFKTKLCKLVKSRWSNLRDSWIKHMKKRMQPDCRLTRNYTYHDQMLFLTNVYQFELDDNFFGTEENVCETIIVKEEKFSSEDDDSSPSVIFYPQLEPKPSVSYKRNIEEVEETSEEEMKLDGENRHISFFKAIIPSINEFQDSQTLEFQIGVLELIRSIKKKKCS
ncbi:unnamed protein product [Ceutorhynchus assimilis]|uniref:MADF domain-containing protein n=1 Tax=Ceutorhynchus assimilis TaxID=467358 RepID=A0A9N9QIB2_9CUCU|nr:unnamed protein product [Ceutorhynchus assimilis]